MRGSRARSALAPQALPDSSRLFLCSPGTHGLAGRAAPPALRASVKTFGRTGRSACTSDQDFVKGTSRSRKNPLLLENQPALRTPNERTGGGQRHVQEAAGPRAPREGRPPASRLAAPAPPRAARQRFPSEKLYAKITDERDLSVDAAAAQTNPVFNSRLVGASPRSPQNQMTCLWVRTDAGIL